MNQNFPADPVAAVTHPDPYPFYADLVARAPFERNARLGVWVAASAEAVTAVLTSPLCRVRPPAEPVPNALLGSSAGDIFGRLVRMTDGPDQQALKRAVMTALGTIDGAKAAEPSRTWARKLRTEGSTAAEIGYRLPALVIGSLLGVGEESLPRLASLVGDFAPAFAPGSSSEQLAHGREAADHLLDLFRSLPPEGLLGALSRERGKSDSEMILANAIGFLFQAYDSTAGLIGNTLLALAAHRDLVGRSAADPDVLRRVILEVLRYDPPVQNTRRFVVEEGLIAGRQMAPGDAVLVVLAAANRDPAVNPDPDRFDIDRADRRLFTFGLGAHACPGETLATTIAQAGIEALLQDGFDVEGLSGGVTYRPSANARIPSLHS